MLQTTKTSFSLSLCTLAMGIMVLATSLVSTTQASIALTAPDDRAFVLDVAGLLNPAQTQQVVAVAEQLLNETAVPLMVVAIERKADYTDTDMDIETFAATLYDQWGIGQATLGDEAFNRGILLVVARSDREARIELGGGYEDRMNTDAQWIMDNRLLPRFREGDFGGGIVAGVTALDQMARGELQTSGWLRTSSGDPLPRWYYAIGILLIGLAVFTAISMHRKGRHGWAFAFWAMAAMILFTIARSSNRKGGSGGGFGGGSFGGGRSGGGGASGRW